MLLSLSSIAPVQRRLAAGATESRRPSPISQCILQKSTISSVIKLGMADSKRWFAPAHEHLVEIVASGRLIVWPLGRNIKQSQAELDLLLAYFDEAKTQCSVIQFNWHLLADYNNDENYGQAAKRYRLLDSILWRSVGTLKRLWIACYKHANDDAAFRKPPTACSYRYANMCACMTALHCRFERERTISVHADFGEGDRAPFCSLTDIRDVMMTLGTVLNSKPGGLGNLRDLVLQWPIAEQRSDFERPTLAAVLQAAPKLERFYVESCPLLRATGVTRKAVSFIGRYDLCLPEPMSAPSLKRIHVGHTMAHHLAIESFFDDLKSLSATALQRVEWIEDGDRAGKVFRKIQAKRRMTDEYELLPAIRFGEDPTWRWLSASLARRRSTPGSDRPAPRVTATMRVYVFELDGVANVAEGQAFYGWQFIKIRALNALADDNAGCAARPRQLRLFLEDVAGQYYSDSDGHVRGAAAIAFDKYRTPFQVDDVAAFHVFTLCSGNLHERVQRAVGALDSAWRGKVWQFDTELLDGDLHRSDKWWAKMSRMLDVLPSVRRIDLEYDLPSHTILWAEGVIELIGRMEQDGKWKLKRLSLCCNENPDLPTNMVTVYGRLSRHLRAAYANHCPYAWVEIVIVRAGMTRQSWFAEHGIVA